MGQGNSHHYDTNHHPEGRVPICNQGFYLRAANNPWDVRRCERNIPGVHYEDWTRWKRDWLDADPYDDPWWFVKPWKYPFKNYRAGSNNSHSTHTVHTSAASAGVVIDLKTVLVIAACLGAHLALNYFGDALVGSLSQHGRERVRDERDGEEIREGEDDAIWSANEELNELIARELSGTSASPRFIGGIDLDDW